MVCYGCTYATDFPMVVLQFNEDDVENMKCFFSMPQIHYYLNSQRIPYGDISFPWVTVQVPRVRYCIDFPAGYPYVNSHLGNMMCTFSARVSIYTLCTAFPLITVLFPLCNGMFPPQVLILLALGTALLLQVLTQIPLRVVLVPLGIAVLRGCTVPTGNNAALFGTVSLLQVVNLHHWVLTLLPQHTNGCRAFIF